MWSGVGTWTSPSLTLLLPCLRQVHNVAFAFELMLDGGLKKPKARPEGNTLPEQLRAQREGQQGPGPQATCVSMGSRRFFPAAHVATQLPALGSLSSSANCLSVSFCRCGEFGPQIHSAGPLHSVHQVQGCGVTQRLILPGQFLGKENGCVHLRPLLPQEMLPQGGLRLPIPAV